MEGRARNKRVGSVMEQVSGYRDAARAHGPKQRRTAALTTRGSPTSALHPQSLGHRIRVKMQLVFGVTIDPGAAFDKQFHDLKLAASCGNVQRGYVHGNVECIQRPFKDFVLVDL